MNKHNYQLVNVGEDTWSVLRDGNVLIDSETFAVCDQFMELVDSAEEGQ